MSVLVRTAILRCDYLSAELDATCQGNGVECYAKIYVEKVDEFGKDVQKGVV